MEIIRTDNLADERIAVYSALNETQLRHYYEPRGGIFIAESYMVITRAIRSGCEPLSFLADESRIRGETEQLLESCSVPVYAASYDVLKELTGFPLTRGLLAAMRRPALPDPEELLRKSRRVAVLEHVTNPSNIGAIFRSAAALGMDAVLLTDDSCDPLCRRSARVSVGTVFQIPWTYFGERRREKKNGAAGWPDAGITLLRECGFTTCAMALDEDAVGIGDPVLWENDRTALILGSEGYGLDRATVSLCDRCVKIPMAEGVDSLNVAAASAVAFWELGRMRADAAGRSGTAL